MEKVRSLAEGGGRKRDRERREREGGRECYSNTRQKER